MRACVWCHQMAMWRPRDHRKTQQIWTNYVKVEYFLLMNRVLCMQVTLIKASVTFWTGKERWRRLCVCRSNLCTQHWHSALIHVLGASTIQLCMLCLYQLMGQIIFLGCSTSRRRQASQHRRDCVSEGKRSEQVESTYVYTVNGSIIYTYMADSSTYIQLFKYYDYAMCMGYLF